MATLLSTQTLTERLNPILTSAGYAPYASLQLSGEPQTLMQQLAKDVPALWMGTPWGSLSFFGVRQADRLDQTSLAQLMDRAFKVALGLLPSTGQLTFKAGLGARSVGLGVYGRILFVWESTPNLAIGKVQQAKRGQFLKKCYVVSWAAVLPEERVYGHKWLPFTMGAPSVSDIQRLLTEI